MSDTPVPSATPTEAPVTPQLEATPVAAPTVEAPKPAPVSPALIAMQRKERELRAKAKELAAKEAEMAAKLAPVSEFQSLKEQAKLDPLKALEYLGITYADVTNYKLNNGRPTPEAKIEQVEAKFKSFVDKQEQDRLAAEEQAKAQAEAEHSAIVADFKEEISSYISANPSLDMLPLVPDSADLIYTTIEDYFKETGKVLSLEESAKLVDEYIYEQIAPALKSKRFAPQAPPVPTVPVNEDPEAGFAIKQPKTLSNAISTPPSVLTARTDEERRQRAMAALMRK